MKGSSRRPEQVAENVRQIVADVLTTELRDPRVGRVTVTAVDVTRDCSHATVRVLVPGTEDEQARALEGLSSAAGFLRTKLARVLTMRSVPQLHFELDRGLEHAARVGALLDELKKERES